MRKGLAATIIILILIIALTPWVVGICFKKNFYELVRALNADNRIKVEVLNYTQGWLHSDAKIRVTEAGGESPMGMFYQFTIDKKITHGPLVINPITHSLTFAYGSIDSTVHVSDATEMQLLGGKTQTGIIQIATLAGFGGHWHNQIHVPTLSMPVMMFGNLIWNGLNGEIDFVVHKDRIKKFHTDIQINDVSMQGQNPFIAQINIAPGHYKSDARQGEQGVWDGNSALTFPSIVVRRTDGSSVSVENMELTSTFNVTNKTFYNIHWSIAAKNIKTPSTILPNVSSFNLALAFNDFSVPGLINFIQYMKSQHSEIMNTTELQAYSNQLLQVFTPTTTMNADIALMTPTGSFTLNGKVYWPSDKPLPKTLQDWIANENANVNIRATIALVDQIIASYAATLPAPVAPPVQTTPTTTGGDDVYNKQVAQLMEQGKISLTLSIQVMELESHHLAPSDFAAGIDKLAIAPDVSLQLKQLYQILLNNKSITVAPVLVATPLNNAQRLQQQISALLAKGLIKKDNNDYVTTITREAGIVKINGIVYNNGMMTTQPTSVVTSPTATTTVPAVATPTTPAVVTPTVTPTAPSVTMPAAAVPATTAPAAPMATPLKPTVTKPSPTKTVVPASSP